MSVWADGFGSWHADGPREVALRAIVRELALRERTSVDDLVAYVDEHVERCSVEERDVYCENETHHATRASGFASANSVMQ